MIVMSQQILSKFLQGPSGKFGSLAQQIPLLGLFRGSLQDTNDCRGTECSQM